MESNIGSVRRRLSLLGACAEQVAAQAARCRLEWKVNDLVAEGGRA